MTNCQKSVLFRRAPPVRGPIFEIIWNHVWIPDYGENKPCYAASHHSSVLEAVKMFLLAISEATVGLSLSAYRWKALA